MDSMQAFTQPRNVCEVCGGEVSAEDLHRAELTIGDVMCPTPMTFHRACYEQAATVWERPSEDSTCVVDRKYPETQRWTPVEQPPVQQQSA